MSNACQEGGGLFFTMAIDQEDQEDQKTCLVGGFSFIGRVCRQGQFWWMMTRLNKITQKVKPKICGSWDYPKRNINKIWVKGYNAIGRSHARKTPRFAYAGLQTEQYINQRMERAITLSLDSITGKLWKKS